MPREKPDPNHHAGKHTGYCLVNGEYFLAPSYRRELDGLRFEGEGVNALIRATDDYAAKQYARIMERRHELWKRLSDDLGVDFIAAKARYNYETGAVSIPEPVEPETVNGGPG